MKKMVKHLIASMLGFVLMLSTILPAIHAEELVPDYSNWALETLNEGEKYGIYPQEWYFDGFRGEASVEKLDALLTLTEQKIASLQLAANEKYSPLSYENNTTRGTVITRLYDIVSRYDLPVGDDAVAYMTERNILKGNGNNLGLEKKVTTEEAVIFAVRFIQDTYRLAGQGAKGVAWVVEDEDTLVYLVGSIHLGTPDIYPFHEQLITAFEESDALILEANLLDAVGAEYYMGKSMFTDGTTLKDVVSEETFAKLEKVAALYELPMEDLLTQKPWFLSSSLMTIGEDESSDLSGTEMVMLGIDRYFLLNAFLQGKPILELEGIKAQADMFDGLTPETQEELLVAILDSILEPTAESEYNPILDWLQYWKNGDVLSLTNSFLESEGEPSEYNSMLFGARDVDMAQKIAKLLEEEEGTYFVVVGAGHFIVDKNIRYHLEQDGYTVEPFYQ